MIIQCFLILYHGNNVIFVEVLLINKEYEYTVVIIQ